MRKLLTILLLIAGSASFAQKADTAALLHYVHAFNKALVKKDTVQLNRMLADNVHYYHSNGMLQLKSDIISDLYSGKLSYGAINAVSQGTYFTGNIAQAKMTADINASMNGKSVDLRLKIVQVWIWKDNRWQMYSRHSERI